MSSFPNVAGLLAGWWGGCATDYPWAVTASLASAASNIVFNGSPLYQISDFLSFLPVYGTGPQGIVVAAPDPSAPGSGYAVDEVLNVFQTDASGGQVKVTAVDGSGVPQSYDVQTPGTGYQVTSAMGAISGVQINASYPGQGYVPGEALTLLQTGASGGQVVVSGTNIYGQILAVALAQGGQGYVVQNGLLTQGGSGILARVDVTSILQYVGVPTSGGTGSGAQVLIQTITPFQGLLVPQAVMQLYINLGMVALQRFGNNADQYRLFMSWYVAHFLTLYLRSASSPGGSAQAAASAGLERGLVVSEGAGDVSHSMQQLTQFLDWGAWAETSWGVQLVTAIQGQVPECMYVL